mgnify:FL=1
MVDIKYANAYSEVLEILKYIPLEDYNKIPKNKIELFKTNANNDYSFNYNPSKTLEEQEVSKIAKGIIAILFRDYWATESQRNKILTKQNYDKMKLEGEKKSKYNPNNLFKNKKIIEEKITTKEMIKYKENIFKNIIIKIKRLLNVFFT